MKKLFIALIITALFLLSACGKAPIADKSGDRLEYKLKDIPEDGFYVHDIVNDTFTPVMNGADGYSGIDFNLGSDSFCWMGDYTLDLISLIPEIDNSHELIAYYESEGNLPKTVTIEEYESLGYTVGVKFIVSEDNTTLYMDNQDTCNSSEIRELLKDNSSNLLPIETINGKYGMPMSNVDKSIDVLLGLEKGKYYDITYFDGTEFNSITAKADTLVLKLKDSTELKRPYKETRSGYFKVDLPDLNKGYYYINGEGLVRVK